MVASALYAQTTTETFGYSGRAGNPSDAYQRFTARKAGFRLRSRSTRPKAQSRTSCPPVNHSSVNENTHVPAAPISTRGPDLPRQRRRLLVVALAHGVDAELREDERAVPRERVQPIEVAAEIRLAVQVDVEGEKVGELGLEILRGREIGVAHERSRVELLDACPRARGETPATRGAPYQRTMSGGISLPTM